MRSEQERLDAVDTELSVKRYQDSSILKELTYQNARDAMVRKFLKDMTDFFRNVENSYRQLGRNAPFEWRGRHDHAIFTQQDDMKKVDLPCFVRTAPSDITMWRHDVNAHVNAINDESMMFSHDQVGGFKNASSIMEVLLDHVLRCKREGIKVVASDNPRVGRTWITVFALPQYILDQGLADIALIVFLENNHGNWPADILFGQLQTRRKRSTIVGIDSLLREFESIRRMKGSIQGRAVNCLACVDFAAV